MLRYLYSLTHRWTDFSRVWGLLFVWPVKASKMEMATFIKHRKSLSTHSLPKIFVQPQAGTKPAILEFLGLGKEHTKVREIE